MLANNNLYRGTSFDGPADCGADDVHYEVCTTRDVFPFKSFIWERYALQDQAIAAARALCARLGQEVWVREVLTFELGSCDRHGILTETEENTIKTFVLDEDDNQVVEA